MSFRIGNEANLPDLGYVLDNQVYCPLCPSKLQGVDAVKAMKIILDYRKELIELNGEEEYNQLLSVVKKVARQMTQGVIMDYLSFNVLIALKK